MSLEQTLDALTAVTEKSLFDTDMPAGMLPDKGDRGANKGTIANFRALCNYYGIRFQYDEISKAQSVIFAGQADKNYRHDLDSTMGDAVLSSLLALNDMPQSAINLKPVLLKENTINPILNFIKEKPYRGDRDYFREVADSLEVNKQDERYRDLVLKMFFIQCVAAADSARHAKCKGEAKFEYVPVFQGGQGIGKTTRVKKLLPESLRNYFGEGKHLDPDNKDSLKGCLSTWICELGELDATFRKSDIERLKAFLSQTTDIIRLPYDKSATTYARRTVFIGTVNPDEFLIDKTGNRRYLPLAIKTIHSYRDDYAYLQQFWAQMWHEYTTHDNAIWWPSAELKAMLTDRHENHTTREPYEELLAERFDLEDTRIDPRTILEKRHYSTTKALMACGISAPTKKQVNDATTFLKNKGFIQQQSSSVRGFYLREKTSGYIE